MIKTILVAAVAVIGMQSHATNLTLEVAKALAAQPSGAQLNWHVNDSADYKMDGMGGILSGTTHMFVRSADATGFWVEEDMDMGMMGQNKAEVQYAPDGHVLKMLVNGQDQALPDPNDTEIVETKNDHITVPKGEFDCMYAKIHDKKQNQDAEVWVNPLIVPIAGLLKQIAQTQFGAITMELTNFVKN